MGKILTAAPVLLTEAVQRPLLNCGDMQWLLVGEGMTMEMVPILDGLIRAELERAGPITALADGWLKFGRWRRKHIAQKLKEARKAAERDFQEKEVSRQLVGAGGKSYGLGFDVWHPTTNQRFDNVDEFRKTTRNYGRAEVGDLYQRDVDDDKLRARGTELTREEREANRDEVFRLRHEAARFKRTGIAPVGLRANVGV